MIEEPKTIEEKIKFLEYCASYVKPFVLIYGQRDLGENYCLCRGGKIMAREWGSARLKYRMSVRDFADRFGEKALDFAIKQVKIRIEIPKNSH